MGCHWRRVSPVISILIVLLLCFTSSICSAQPANSSYISRVANESRKSNYIETLLMKINKPAVKTFQVNGDIIDCVLSHLQPAFDHPLLKGQKPLTAPTEMPKGQDTSNTTDNIMFEEGFQIWNMSGESCPENTIPIKRKTEQDVLRATSEHGEFGQKIDLTNHDHGIGYADGNFFGAKATISVWNPRVENNGEFSLSQLWLLAGSFGDGSLNSIEAGWQVFPGKYGDNYPKLFVYWTSNAYQGGAGCYNLDCPGFVQTSQNFVFGATTITPVSSYNGAQYAKTFLVWKDSTGNWWLQINNENVGYWPSSLVPLLKDQASEVQFGGEIVNNGGAGAHTKTEMGSGHFPSEGYGKAAYIRNIELVDQENKLYSAPKLTAIVAKPNCYSIETFQNGPIAGWASYLFYGGPGGANPGCE